MFTSNFNTVLDRLMMVSQGLDEAPVGAANAVSEGRSRDQLWMPPH